MSERLRERPDLRCACRPTRHPMAATWPSRLGDDWPPVSPPRHRACRVGAGQGSTRLLSGGLRPATDRSPATSVPRRRPRRYRPTNPYRRRLSPSPAPPPPPPDQPRTAAASAPRRRPRRHRRPEPSHTHLRVLALRNLRVPISRNADGLEYPLSAQVGRRPRWPASAGSCEVPTRDAHAAAPLPALRPPVAI